jgi:hypothetical protein
MTYGADTLEAVRESSGIAPVFTTDVAGILTVGGTTTADADNTSDDENNDDGKLETRGPEFLLSVTKRSENRENKNNEEEDCNPCSEVHVVLPVVNCGTGNSLNTLDKGLVV